MLVMVLLPLCIRIALPFLHFERYCDIMAVMEGMQEVKLFLLPCFLCKAKILLLVVNFITQNAVTVILQQLDQLRDFYKSAQKIVEPSWDCWTQLSHLAHQFGVHVCACMSACMCTSGLACLGINFSMHGRILKYLGSFVYLVSHARPRSLAQRARSQ